MTDSIPKHGDHVRVKATGETGWVISTQSYNARVRGNLKPRHWIGTKWVLFDNFSTDRPMVVGYGSTELEVLGE